MSFSAWSLADLACGFDLVGCVRNLFSFSMSLTEPSVFVAFSFGRDWTSLDVDFVRERAGIRMCESKGQDKFKLRKFVVATRASSLRELVDGRAGIF